ncbi:hypothetical protein LINGRAHAP2_LOCUS30508 [Linum grandiflorum]
MWKSRNQRVFINVSTSVEGLLAQVACWKNTLLICEKEANVLRQAVSSTRVAREVVWDPKPEPWFTLNVDGSVNHDGRAAGGRPPKFFGRLYAGLHDKLWSLLYYASRATCNYRWAITRLGVGCSPCCDRNRLFSRYEDASTTSIPGPPTRYFGASIQRALTPELGSTAIPHISGGELSCGLPS